MGKSCSHSPNQSASAIYVGNVRHRRFTPVDHLFQYRITMLLLDLDHLDSDLGVLPLTSARVPAIGWFRRRDYAGDQSENLKSYILRQVEAETGAKPDGKVLLLTHLRYWGFIMNPISIFYCYNQSSELVATVLQVTNTPWREKILYVLPSRFTGKNYQVQFQKRMHVSPFNPMDMQYHCRLQIPGRTLFFHLENYQSNEKITDATMVFKHHEMTPWRLALLVLTQPAMTLRVGLGIYWQALRLWVKRTPVFDHPGKKATRENDIKPTTTIRHSD
ncbi:MAG: DUF1365 domain-containing protein [Acidiferrobacterales bacterium]|nr:DUF1365 domain-containing protein [Acidiferrobacterales bacterium]